LRTAARDLLARPIGRNVIDPTQRNRAYEILSRKFWRTPDHDGHGLHVLAEPASDGGNNEA
jgi:hypothetical protein